MMATELVIKNVENENMSNYFSLLDLEKGKTAKIKAIISNVEDFGNLDEAVTQRLKDFGFLVGHDVTLIGYGFLGKDPIAVKIGSSQFALRHSEAIKIQLELDSEQHFPI